MDVQYVLGLIASAGHLAVAALVVVHLSSGAVGRPLLALCLVLFTWNFAAMAYRVTGAEHWHTFDVVASPWTAPLLQHVVLAFVGKLRQRRLWLWLSYGASLALSLSGAGAFVSLRSAHWTESKGWSLALLAISVPFVLLSMGHLAWYARTSEVLLERRRAWAMLTASVLGTVLGLTDVWDDFVPSVPSLGHLGTFAASAIIAGATLRLRLLDVRSTRAAAWLAMLGGAACAAVHVLILRFWGSQVSAVALAASLVSVAGFVAGHTWLSEAKERSERARHMALLGRFSAQMSHDLRNPLAALKGAVQYLEFELAKPRGTADVSRYLALMNDQVDRILGCIERYSRVSRVHAVPRRERLNDLVDGVVQMQSLTSGHRRIELDLSPGLEATDFDPELLATALQDVIQNALDATSDHGRIRISTECYAERVRLEVADDGCGMDPRQVERALDEFFTTKPTGTGLGLPFAKRVAEAHGGRLLLESSPDRGTKVVFDLPRVLPGAEPIVG